ncbi:uncharacterized protein LOC131288817 [Anopheles ziemanni]|uniref:uncharacterized protein LOC131259483 n=1 Tax=Anopheles coustani TaxID=139045 RepID=UPI00265A4A11|nr:uncharacterized protein LOC131259483 [Anopheles coustani]XP_058173977.1 uncharacterized protein LOC131288817 [Anopheles ziemanni]
MLCRRMRLTERHLQPPREPLEGPIVRPCTARKLLNLDTGPGSTNPPPSPHNAISHATITIPTGDTTEPAYEGQPFSPRGSRKPNECPKTPLMIVNLNIPPGTETLAPKSASRAERHKLPPFCVQYRNLTRFCSAPAASSGVPATSGAGTTPHILGPNGGTGSGAMIPQIFIQSFELQDRRAADGQGPVAAAGADGQPGSQQYNIITENDEDTFATLLLDNISNISLEMIQRHQQKLLGTAGSSLTEGHLVTGASGGSVGTCVQHADGCSSMERTESKTSTDGALALDMRMDSTEEGEGRRGEMSAGQRRSGAVQEAGDEQQSDIPPGYRSLCYRTPSPKTRQIIRVDIVTSREKY